MSLSQATIKSLNIDNAFGKVLKQTREKKGLSQEQLAFDSGLHRTYISLIERGKRSPSLRTLERIVNALDLRLSVMIKNVENLAGEKHADS
jgi:transcriptional regulator with XRE-family HTH domain